MKTEREIYSKNVSDYEKEIRKLEKENTTQKDAFTNLETNLVQDLKQITKQKNSFRRQVQFQEGKISNLINKKRELTGQLTTAQTDLKN